jgi:hypothetical protein
MVSKGTLDSGTTKSAMVNPVMMACRHFARTRQPADAGWTNAAVAAERTTWNTRVCVAPGKL